MKRRNKARNYSELLSLLCQMLRDKRHRQINLLVTLHNFTSLWKINRDGKKDFTSKELSVQYRSTPTYFHTWQRAALGMAI